MESKTVSVDGKGYGEDDVRKFATRIRIDNETGCWVWNGALGGHRTGTLSLRSEDGRLVHINAKRFAWATVHGPIVRGQLVESTCGNVLCVNPEHLRISTISTEELAQVLDKLGVR
jgi:hypothetical protein